MDFTGTLLGALTIPMVLMNIASMFGAAWLMARGQWGIVLTAAGAIICLLVLFSLMIRVADSIAEAAHRAMHAGRIALAKRLAAISSVWIVAVIFGWALLVLMRTDHFAHDDLAIWAVSYAVATLPWTLLAHWSSREDATITGLRAYAAQLGYLILLVTVIAWDWPLLPALVPVAVPMLLPLVVGYLLAKADRDMLRNVRI